MFSTLRFSCIFYCHCIPFCYQVQPSPEEECISHPSVPDVSLCGVYKLSKDFYIDCSLARNLEGRYIRWPSKVPRGKFNVVGHTLEMIFAKLILIIIMN